LFFHPDSLSVSDYKNWINISSIDINPIAAAIHAADRVQNSGVSDNTNADVVPVMTYARADRNDGIRSVVL
jgi:hypothetical protein